MTIILKAMDWMAPFVWSAWPVWGRGAGGALAGVQGFLLKVKNLPKLAVGVVAQLGEYTKSHWITFQMIELLELYLNTAVLLKKKKKRLKHLIEMGHFEQGQRVP